MAEIFDSVAALALEEDELRQDRRAATAQARTSAVVVGIPVMVIVYRMLSGDLARRLSANALSAFLTIAGVTLMALGVAVMLVLIKRATP